MSVGAQPMLGKYCAWCELPAVAEIEVAPAIVKNNLIEKAAQIVPVCDDHRTITEGQPPPLGMHRRRKDKSAVQLDIFGGDSAGKPGNAITGEAA